MFTISDFAALSLYVYKNSVEIEKYIPTIVAPPLFTAANFNPHNPDNIYEIILNPSIQNNLGDAFYASLYVKISEQRPTGVVFAIRGTDDLANEVQDFATWGNYVLGIQKKLNGMPNYTNPALSFLKQANDYSQHQLKLNPNQLFVTGHSLGGAIAALLKAKFGILNRVITFNAPGIRTMPGVNLTIANILNIRARYDFIGRIDDPIGPLLNIDVPQNEMAAKQAFTLYKENQKNSHLSFIQEIKNNLVLTDDVLTAIKQQHSIANLYMAIQTQQNKIMSISTFDNLYSKYLNTVSNDELTYEERTQTTSI